MKKILLFLIATSPLFSFSQNVFINEIHYDNAGGDVNEGIEIAGPEGTDLAAFSLVLYNGNGGSAYNTVNLSGIVPDQQNGFGTLFFPISGVQNGSPDGLALVENGTVAQFLSYEGAFTAVGGPANGLLSEDIGVSEAGSTPIGRSLQLSGQGTTYTDFTWSADTTSTYDLVNIDQTFGSVAPVVFVNEIHYDNSGSDVGEAIELAGIAGTDLSGWSIVLYNGSNGASYSTSNLSGTITDAGQGFGFITVSYPTNGIQNGAPDGIVLVNAANEVVQFLSYEGSFVAVGGPADGLTSSDIGISESSGTPVGSSLQLTGTGLVFEDFTWTADANTFDATNTGQSFGTPIPPDPDPQPIEGTLFVNEIHYDNAGGDQNEGIEVAGSAGLDLNGWALVLYNGNGGSSYNTVSLSGTVPDQQNGFGTAFFAIPGIQNGSPDGVALVAPGDSVIQFLSYEGSFTAVGGPAYGLPSEDIGVSEASSTPVGFSLQLEGEGTGYGDFTWASPAASTYDAINTNQSFGSTAPVVFVNEIHYDNSGADTGEAIELAGTAGLDLSGWSLVLYNGNGGAPYRTTSLSGTFADAGDGFGFISINYPSNGIQNGSPDGIALVNAGDTVIQFLSYEGGFTAVGGPADGLISEDIGVSESSSTPVGFSLQLEGLGRQYADFTWAAAQANTSGTVNTNQSFGSVIEPPVTGPDTVTVAQARQLPLNTEVVVRAVLTASDQFGGPAYLQDETAGIALFDPVVHGDGLFNIGDELLITASVSEFRNQIQLANVDTVLLLDTGIVVTPAVTTLNQLFNFEGQLVTINDASFNESGVLFPNANYDVSDASGSGEVRIDGKTDLVGRNRPETSTSITGVVGRFQSTVQLLPRFIEDVPGTTPFEPIGSEIPVEQTLDVATWNMEFFGTTISGFGPSNIELQAENALTVFRALEADIIALQEVSDDSLLQIVVDSLPGYQLICSDVFSRSFQEPDPNNPFPPQKLCYLVNTDVVDVVETRVVFDEFYTQARTGQISDLDNYPTSSGASSFWSSGRLPFQLIADVTINGATDRYNIINIHAKSGSGANDLERRVFDNTVLKDTLDAQYANDQLILLGDYNDDVIVSIGGGPSTYAVILDDSANFRAVTRSLSENDIPTFLGGSGSTIDHVTISSELENEVINGAETIYFPFNDIANFEGTTSDHLPVISRFEIIPPLAATTSAPQTIFFGFEPASTATIEVQAAGGVAPYTYEWSTGETTPSISVSPSDTTSYSVTVTDAQGTQATEIAQVNVVDVNCTVWGKPKVQVCFNGRSLCVPAFAAERLLQKGALLGDCSLYDDGAEITNIKVFPNPFIDDISLALTSTSQTTVQVRIRSLLRGTVVYDQSVEVEAGENVIPIDLMQQQRGFYVLTVRKASTGALEKILTLFKK